MKKYIFALLSIIWLGSCTEDRTVDITVMPQVTTTGADTFGCLVDGWLYVGGRYYYRGDFSHMWTTKSFSYNPDKKKLNAHLFVKAETYISFTVTSPEEGKECALTKFNIGDDKLEDGTVFISRFDEKARIISGTFGNGVRLTNGRFDVHYSINESPYYPEDPENPESPENQ